MSNSISTLGQSINNNCNIEEEHTEIREHGIDTYDELTEIEILAAGSHVDESEEMREAISSIICRTQASQIWKSGNPTSQEVVIEEQEQASLQTAEEAQQEQELAEVSTRPEPSYPEQSVTSQNNIYLGWLNTDPNFTVGSLQNQIEMLDREITRLERSDGLSYASRTGLLPENSTQEDLDRYIAEQRQRKEQMNAAIEIYNQQNQEEAPSAQP